MISRGDKFVSLMREGFVLWWLSVKQWKKMYLERETGQRLRERLVAFCQAVCNEMRP
jgi:hypothetical protein